MEATDRASEIFQPQKAGEMIEQDKLKLLIYGKTGSGKTTACAKLPKPIILLTEINGLASIRRANPDADVMMIKSWTEFKYTLVALENQLAQGNCPYESIVLDSLTNLQEMIIEEVKVETGSDHLEYKGWGMAINRTVTAVKSVNILALHSAVICLADEYMDGDKRCIAPSVAGKKLPGQLGNYFSLVFYQYVRVKDEKSVFLVATSAPETHTTKGHPNLNQREFPDFHRLFQLTQRPVAPGAITGFNGTRYADEKLTQKEETADAKN